MVVCVCVFDDVCVCVMLFCLFVCLLDDVRDQQKAPTAILYFALLLNGRNITIVSM